MNFFNIHNNSGYIAFSTLLIVSVVALSIALSISTRSISGGQSSLAYKKGNETLFLAESCMNDALEHIKDSATYSGGTLSTLGGTCTIDTTRNGNSWTVTVQANLSGYTKRIQVELERTGNIVISSWVEI